MRTGYVAENGDAEDLARGIHDLFALGDLPAMREVTASVARERHSPDRVIRLYGELFSGLSNRSVDR
jgi:hypothetical protein